MASLLDPLIKNGTVPPLSVFTPDFAKKYGGADDKVLLMPGPAWYSQALFDQTLHIPAGEITAAAPLQWEGETTGHHRSGRRRPVDHLAALQEHQGCGGLRHLGDDGVQPDRRGRTAAATPPTDRSPTAGSRRRPPTPTSPPIPRRR